MPIIAMYRCRLCGAVYEDELNERASDRAYKTFHAYMGLDRSGLSFGVKYAHPYPDHVIHLCDGESCGVADFAGIRTIGEDVNHD